MKGDKKPKVTTPTAKDLQPLLDMQMKYSQVGAQTPFGSQTYRTNPDGSRTLVTSLTPGSEQMLNRALALSQTDSDQMYIPQQVNQIAQGVANRVGNRFGMAPQQGMQLQGSKPQQGNQMLPQAQNLPPTPMNQGGP
jgi:hypothetical protein